MLGMLVIWASALVMRLWQLGALDPPVFDEVYFPVFAQEYLDGIAPFDVHPPLGKYEIALGILALGRTAIGMRISTAIAGSFIPVVVAGLAYKLTYRSRLAFIAGSLMLLEGLFLVESRLGLMNVWLVLFGLTAQIYAIAGLESRGWRRLRMLTCCGALLGASASVKWSGLGFALGLGGTLTVASGLSAISSWRAWPVKVQQLERQLGIWKQVKSLQWWHFAVCLGLLPVAVYVAQWLPHVWLLSDDSSHSIQALAHQLGDIHLQMLSGHANASPLAVGDEPIHPYCSQWWSWPLLGRPIAYFFEDGGEQWRAVYALGNPFLWWGSTLAIAGLLLQSFTKTNGVSIYILTNYAANLLPWVLVERCIFLYHYMGALVFSVLALAFLLDKWLFHSIRMYRWLGWNITVAILACAIFFGPIWLGLPLSPDGFYQRMWFRGRWLLEFNWI